LQPRDVLALLVVLGLFACSSEEPEPAEPAAAPVADASDLGPRWRGQPGFWRKAPAPAAVSESDREMIARLQAIGYEAGTQVERLGAGRGVVRFDPDAAFPGRNLMVSAHASEVLLLDMRGRVLHRWAVAYDDAYPGTEPPAPAEFIRAATALPDGRLLAIFEGSGLVMLDRDSRILWTTPLLAHHDVAVFDDAVYVLTRAVARRAEVFGDKYFLEDFVSILDLTDGSERRSISLVEAVRAIDAEWLGRARQRYGDLLHTNSIAVLDGRAAAVNPAFARGNILVSILTLDTLAVLDPSSGRFVWTYSGGFDGQHDARPHADATVTVFDNQHSGSRSRVGRIDLRTGQLEWTHGVGSGEHFFTPCCGIAQRLPNDDMLVTESEFGRAVELAPDGRVVWEYVSPYRAGPRKQYIALLFSMRRLPADFGDDWLSPAP
jgi:hypothetical protein